ncbi:MAG: DUF4430 domain-containing protein [Solirubrobacterales bacterium]
MPRPPALLAALLVLAGLAVGACSVGAGDSDPEGATLTATRDFGRRVLLERRADTVRDGETVMRFLQRYAEVDTGYGGRFVNAIEDLRSGSREGVRRDWFYYVNGIEADTGAAEREVFGGDRVWWDHRDWSVAMRVPAVVGSFPEPFLHGSDGKRFPVRIDCAGDSGDRCEELSERLQRAGIEPSTAALGSPAGDELLRLVVGRWEDVRSDSATSRIEDGPAESGVFARVRRGASGYEIDVLDSDGRVVEALGPGGGIVAATRSDEQQPTWTVSGVDDAGLERAVRLVGTGTLRNRYAVAAGPDGARPLPAPEGGSR